MSRNVRKRTVDISMECGFVWSGDMDVEEGGHEAIECLGDVAVEKDGEDKLEGKENK